MRSVGLPEDGMVNLPLRVWFQSGPNPGSSSNAAALYGYYPASCSYTTKEGGEYLLAAQTGLGLQDLPLVPGDPEGGGEGKEALVFVYPL